MPAEIAETTMKPQKRYFTMADVLAQVNAAGIAIDEETVDYHLYRTRKMPKPVKKVKPNVIGPQSRSSPSSQNYEC